MRSMKTAAVLPVLLAVMVAACGPGSGSSSGGGNSSSKGTITVGGFNFPESTILAQLYAKVLTQGGYTVTVKASLGNREIVEPALEKGDIDVYPGYAATELEFLNKAKGEATPDPTATVAKLNTYLDPKGLKALTPSPADDENAFVVTKATADKYKLATLSDLGPASPNLRLGGPPECPTRPFCQAGLNKVYGTKFKEFKPTDPGGPITVAALEKGDIDVGLLFSSDGVIAAKGFVLLKDDKHLQNADNIVPLVRTKTVPQDAQDLLNKVDAALTTADLIDMNKKVGTDKQDADAVAQAWLKGKGLLK